VSLFGARRHPRTAPLPVEGHLPGFDGTTGWLNSSPRTPAELRGRVVLVDFWTYTCINWRRHLVRRVYRLLQPPASDTPQRPPIISPAGTTIACHTPTATST
jgi:hypothetical protein